MASRKETISKPTGTSFGKGIASSSPAELECEMISKEDLQDGCRVALKQGDSHAHQDQHQYLHRASQYGPSCAKGCRSASQSRQVVSADFKPLLHQLRADTSDRPVREQQVDFQQRKQACSCECISLSIRSHQVQSLLLYIQHWSWGIAS